MEKIVFAFIFIPCDVQCELCLITLGILGTLYPHILPAFPSQSGCLKKLRFKYEILFFGTL